MTMAGEAAVSARDALYKAIEAQAKSVIEDEYPVIQAAPILRDLAIAYRAANGGPQPGSVVIEK
jgi:hypothetical protein